MDINAGEVIGDVAALLPALEAAEKAIADAVAAARAKDAAKTQAALEVAATHLESSLAEFDAQMAANRKKIDEEIAALPTSGPAGTEPKP